MEHFFKWKTFLNNCLSFVNIIGVYIHVIEVVNLLLSISLILLVSIIDRAYFKTLGVFGRKCCINRLWSEERFTPGYVFTALTETEVFLIDHSLKFYFIKVIPICTAKKTKSSNIIIETQNITNSKN